MAKNREIIIAPRGGLRYDVPADLISSVEMSDCRNIWFSEGRVKKRYGYTTMGGNLPLAGPVNGFYTFEDFSGNTYLVCATTKLPYYLASPASSPYWEPIQEGEVEDDCETTWTSDMGANGAVADETSIIKVGSTSQKISPAAGFSTGLAAHHDSALGDKSDYAFVVLWIRSSVAQAEGDLQFLIDDASGCGSATETLDIPALASDTWKRVVLEASDPSSNMSSIASLGLNIAADNGACDIYIDDIQFCKSFGSSVAYDSDDTDLTTFTSIRKSSETDPWMIMTNGVDAIKKWTGSGDVSNLISDSPSGVTALLAKQCIEFKSHLLLLDVTEDGNRYPQRIRWSDTSDPEDFLNGNASYQDLTGPDFLKGAVTFKGDYLVVCKEKSLWLGYATGESDIFQFDRKVENKGCLSGRTIKAEGDFVYFMGDHDIYAFDGIGVESIADRRVRAEIFRTANPAQYAKSLAVLKTDQHEYWLFVVDINGTYCDVCWCYNYELRTWTRFKTADVLTSGGHYAQQNVVAIDDLSGTIDEQAWRIGSVAGAEETPIDVFGDTDGYVYQYSHQESDDYDTAIDGWFSTYDFNPTKMGRRFRVNRIDVYFEGNGLDIEYSTDKGGTWTTIESLTASNNLEQPNSVFLKLDCLLCRLRFRNNISGEHFDFSRATVYWQPSGGRLK